jgi:hypothetical protein
MKMLDRISMALVFLAMPALADSRLFREIRNKDTVTLVLPNGECDAKVVSRNLNELTLRLKKKTAGCGEHNAIIALSRFSVSDVVDNRRRILHGPSQSWAAFCTTAAITLVGAPSALAIGETTGSDPAALLILFGSAIGGAVLCRERGARYTVFINDIISAQP